MNVFTVEYENYKQSKLYDRLKAKYEAKPYYKQYAPFRIIALISSYLFNIISGITASSLVYFFIFGMSSNTILSIAITAMFIILLEVTKRKASYLLVKEAMQRQTYYPLGALVICLLLISVSFSYYGSQRLVLEYTAPPTSIKVQNLTKPLQDQLAQIDSQIKQARNTQWRGTTTTASQRTIEALTKSRLSVQSRILEIESNTEKQNATIVQDHQKTTSVKAEYFALFTLLLEFGFLLCAWYIEYYDFRSYNEFEQIAQSKFGSTPKASAPTIKTKQTAAPIATKDIKPTKRLCGNCSKDISGKRSDAKFCNPECRKASWTKAKASN